MWLLLYRERIAALAYYTIQMLYIVGSFSSNGQFGSFSFDDQFTLRVSVHWEEKASGTGTNQATGTRSRPRR